MSGSRCGFVGFALCTLAVAACSGEPRFPFEAAKRATAIRISRADLSIRTSVREINDSAVLQRVLKIIDQSDSWEPMPECQTGTCNDITIEWVSGSCDDRVMPSSPLTELLKLAAGDRAELAMALWESLTDAEREGEFELSDVDRAEFDRRWAEHVDNPDSAIPWSEVRSKLLG